MLKWLSRYRLALQLPMAGAPGGKPKYPGTLFILAVIALLALAPKFTSLNLVTILTLANFMAVFAMSWDILSGYTGQISFGHAFFIGAAGYTSALLNFHLGLPLWLTIPLGAAAAVLAGLLVAAPALRLRGPYLALVTLILPIVARRLILIFSSVTGGEFGLAGIDTISLSLEGGYYWSLGLMITIAWALRWLSRSKIGKIFTAIRENEEVVEAAGINTAKYKTLSFVISSLVAGLGGSFFVHYLMIVSPNSVLSLSLSIQVIIATVLGGVGTITGPIVGGYILVVAQEHLRSFEQISDWRIFIFVSILLVLMLTARRGLGPEIRSFIKKRGGRLAAWVR
ncbi:MAG: branched-chain amino acid ABC transporter permease [Candidatus Bipolaricaulia bacterium]